MPNNAYKEKSSWELGDVSEQAFLTQGLTAGCYYGKIKEKPLIRINMFINTSPVAICQGI